MTAFYSLLGAECFLAVLAAVLVLAGRARGSASFGPARRRRPPSDQTGERT